MKRCPTCSRDVPSDAAECLHCGNALPREENLVATGPVHPPDGNNPAGFSPGELVAGRYRIVGPIGKGAMGEVYHARDARLDQDVALKLLPERFANDPDHLARFHAEV